MPEFCDAGLRSLLIGALEEVLLFLGGLAAFVPVLGPWPLIPCAKAAPEAAARMTAAVIAIFNFIKLSGSIMSAVIAASCTNRLHRRWFLAIDQTEIAPAARQGDLQT
jgi:hypothetical protein